MSDSEEKEYKLEELDASAGLNKVENVSARTQTNNNEDAFDTAYNKNSSLKNTQLTGSELTSMTPTTKANLEPTATVKFMLLPSKQVVTRACSLKMTIGEIRNQFSVDLKIDKSYLKFMKFDGKKRPKYKNLIFSYFKINIIY